MVRTAQPLTDLALRLRARSRDNLAAQRFGNLDRWKSYTARAGMDENPLALNLSPRTFTQRKGTISLTRLEFTPPYDPLITRRIRQTDSRSLFQGDVVRYEMQYAPVCGDLLRVGAECRAEDAVAGFERASGWNGR
jgi:hypothetical protein